MKAKDALGFPLRHTPFNCSCVQAVGTFEGLLEEVTQYKESDRLLADPLAASGDMAIAEGLTFTNKAASSLHRASVKVGSTCPQCMPAYTVLVSSLSQPLVRRALPAADHVQHSYYTSGPVNSRGPWSTQCISVLQQVAGGILMSADAVSKRMMDHYAKVQASSEPGPARPVPGAIKASATMTRAGTKVLSKTAGKVG